MLRLATQKPDAIYSSPPLLPHFGFRRGTPRNGAAIEGLNEMERKKLKGYKVNKLISLLAVAFAGILLVTCGKYYVDESPAESVTLDAGTELTVSPTSDLSPLDENAGEGLAAVLAAPIVIEGGVVAPKGAPVRGEVVLSKTSDDESGRIAFRLRQMTVHGGNEVAIDTDTVYKFSPSSGLGDATMAPVVSESDTLLFKLANPVTFSFIPDEALGSL